MIRVAIVDDHKLLIDGLKLIIGQEEDIEIVFVAYNGQQIISQLEEDNVDIVLLDIDLPVLNGIETCKVIKERFPETKVLVLTTHDKGAFIQQMLKAGALGYVLKNAAPEELVIAIRKVNEGITYLTPEANLTLMNTLRNEHNQKQTFLPELTRREKEILNLIADELTTKEIAQKLHLSENTIETHRRNLLSKMNVRNVAGLIKVALSRGLIK